MAASLKALASYNEEMATANGADGAALYHRSMWTSGLLLAGAAWQACCAGRSPAPSGNRRSRLWMDVASKVAAGNLTVQTHAGGQEQSTGISQVGQAVSVFQMEALV